MTVNMQNAATCLLLSLQVLWGGCWPIQVEMQGRVLPSFTRGTGSFQITPKRFSLGSGENQGQVSFIDSAHSLVVFLCVVLLK